MDDIGIWPRFRGRAMRDRWVSYDAYAGAHSLCGAHVLRDCLSLAEQEQQTWAAEKADHLLALLDDLTLPCTNNLAERDLRMMKGQQKIAGTFRSDEGAPSFCRIRSYLSTMHQQGHSMLAAVFAGQPLPVAWAPV